MRLWLVRLGALINAPSALVVYLTIELAQRCNARRRPSEIFRRRLQGGRTAALKISQRCSVTQRACRPHGFSGGDEAAAEFGSSGGGFLPQTCTENHPAARPASSNQAR